MSRWSLALLSLALLACRPAQPAAPLESSVAPSSDVPAALPASEKDPTPPPQAERPATPPEEIPGPEAFVYSEPNFPDDNWILANECPGEEACMFSRDFAVFIAKKGSGVVYIFDYADSRSALREGRPPWRIVWARLEYGARSVLAQFDGERIRGSCGLVSRLPAMYAASAEEGLLVQVPPGPKPPKVPRGLTPEAANKKIAAAYARFDEGERDDRLAAFPADALDKMTEDTLDDPRVRHYDAWRSSSGGKGPAHESLLSVDVLYSETSRRVYVIDSSYYDERLDKKGKRRVARRKRDRGTTLLRTAQALGIPEFRFALEAACWIPKVFGDQKWFDLTLDQTEADRETLRASIAEGQEFSAKARAAAARNPVRRVRQGEITSTAGLDSDIIRRIVRAHINELRHCYRKALVREPALHGEVVANFDIGPDGKSRGTGIERASLENAAMHACTLEAISRWKFPKPEGGATVHVQYPFTFEPG